LRRLAATNFTELAGSNFTVVAAFDLALSGILPGQRLPVQYADLPTNALFVLARVLSERGLYGLEPRERLASDERGNLASLEPATGSRLPGLTSAGQYLLLHVNTPQGLIEGIARNSAGQPADGLAMRLAPWLTFSGPNGAYQLLGNLGTNQLSIIDGATGDAGETAVVVTEPQAVVVADAAVVAAGPRVVSVTPAAGATSVPRVTPVIVRFNKAISPGGALNGAQLLGSNGVPVAASVSLNLPGTELTLLPVNPLAPSTPHTLLLATNPGRPKPVRLHHGERSTGALARRPDDLRAGQRTGRHGGGRRSRRAGRAGDPRQRNHRRDGHGAGACGRQFLQQHRRRGG
jgi:hypothetical protein